METTKLIVLIGSFAAMLVGMVYVFLKKKDGFGPNTLRALGTVLFMPAILILATVTEFKTETLAALLGTIAGYLLSRSESEESK